MKKLGSYLFVTSRDGNVGYLMLRILIGLGMATHGLPKLTGGPEVWARVGGVMAQIGVPGLAVFWGFMAALAEGVGGILLIFGAFTTVSTFLMSVTMAVAVFVFHSSDPFAGREMALLYLFSALMFMLKGAGRYSIDYLLSGKKSGA